MKSHFQSHLKLDKFDVLLCMSLCGIEVHSMDSPKQCFVFQFSNVVRMITINNKISPQLVSKKILKYFFSSKSLSINAT
jgi:hypothetical protein